MIELLNIDCMDYMSTCKDKQFDLAIVDPPYGIGYENGGQYFNKMQGKEWDKVPDEHYFNELFRISQNQIIWGANYFSFDYHSSRCIIAWTKTNEIQDRTFGEWEFAWTSFSDKPAKFFNLKPFQRNGSRIHPTQKPIQLYKWLLRNYAKPTDKIIDTHGGSMSSVIACYDFGITDMVCCEIDKEYYDAAVKRFETYKLQQKLQFK